MNERNGGVEAWKKHTTAFDRVRAIAQALDRPQSAQYIATEAAVSETTANDHLDRLVEMNVLRTVSGEAAQLYEPDPLYARFRALRELLDSHTHDELLGRKISLQRRIEEISERYGVSSPEMLRERAVESDTASETVKYRQDASEWALSLYHLSLVEDAIENYSEYERLDTHATA